MISPGHLLIRHWHELGLAPIVNSNVLPYDHGLNAVPTVWVSGCPVDERA